MEVIIKKPKIKTISILLSIYGTFYPNISKYLYKIHKFIIVDDIYMKLENDLAVSLIQRNS